MGSSGLDVVLHFVTSLRQKHLCRGMCGLCRGMCGLWLIAVVQAMGHAEAVVLALVQASYRVEVVLQSGLGLGLVDYRHKLALHECVVEQCRMAG